MGVGCEEGWDGPAGDRGARVPQYGQNSVPVDIVDPHCWHAMVCF